MNVHSSLPLARLTVITVGTADMRRAIAFYAALGFTRGMKATGEEVAFFDAGGTVLALYPWDRLAGEADCAAEPRPAAFRGVTLAWNCASREDVDRVLSHALACGARLQKPANETHYGGYAGYFLDPDGHVWEVVVAPGLDLRADGLIDMPD